MTALTHPDDIAAALRDCQTDHLFVLIGLNPLPNYVAARLLLRPGGKLYMVRAARATPEALERTVFPLGRILQEEHNIQMESIFPVAEADGDAIFKEVEKQAKKITQGTIGLHYTGGTKAMSTHAYRALEKLGSATHQNIVFSYLDAHTRTLMVEPVGGKPKRAIRLTRWPIELGIGGPPDLDGLAKLQKEIVLSPKRLLSKPDNARELLDVFAAPALDSERAELAAAWRHWLTNTLYASAKKSGRSSGNWKKDENLQSIVLPWPASGALSIYKDSFQKVLDPAGATGLSIARAAKQLGAKKLWPFCDWLDGFWLEDAVLGILNDLRPTLDLQEPRRSIELQGIVDDNKCEIDVVALRGYQLFGFSCTTSADAGSIRKKWMAALLRGQQLGGDEARIALVTFFDRTDALRSEFAQKWQVDEQIKIFGPADFGNLKDAISNWMERV